MTNIGFVLRVLFRSFFRSLRTVSAILFSPRYAVRRFFFFFPLEPPPSVPRSTGLFLHELSEPSCYVYYDSGTPGHKLCIFPSSHNFFADFPQDSCCFFFFSVVLRTRTSPISLVIPGRIEAPYEYAIAILRVDKQRL